MDREAHKRFLNYLEKYDYFRGPHRPKLSREQWVEYDRERQPLEVKAKKDHLTAEELIRLRAIRGALLVD